MKKAALMTVALVLLCSATAFAGGGGAATPGRNNGTLRVVNSTGATLFVRLSTTGTTTTVLAGPYSIFDFRAVPGTNVTVTASNNANFANPTTVNFARTILPAGQVSLVRFTGAALTPGIVMNSISSREVMFASFGLGGIAVLVLAGYALNRKSGSKGDRTKA